ncbi:hypothetical protein [Halalkalibacillus halophilus]|uniref:hypothetical protein n=1 Tax=Halalkalibacillus halophilus TaxID=392827 RepID=UPI00040F061C|nr:hypothetical protein [Halalkalibacillus halophilus]
MTFKRLISFGLIGLLVFTTTAGPASVADTEDTEQEDTDSEGSYEAKHEVIYSNLSASGTQQSLYVINQFDVTEPGQLTDSGTYAEVHNLTNLEDMENDDGQVTFTATDSEPFYYQGDVDEQALPWSFNINYFLDGEEMEPEEMLGQDGQVTIAIETEGLEEDTLPFYENYLLQISMTLESDIFRQVEAADGTVASAGQDQQVTFTVLPEEDGDFSVEANATDFEFGGFEISAIPNNMSVDSPETDEMVDELGSLSDGIADVHDGVSDLQGGISELNDGVVELQDGSAAFLNGAYELEGSSSDLVSGSQSIQTALQQINQNLAETGDTDLSELRELEDGLREMSGGLYGVADGLETLRINYQEAFGALDETMATIPNNEISEEEIQALYNTEADADVLDQLVASYEASLNARGTYYAVRDAFTAVEPTLNEMNDSIENIAYNLDRMANELNNNMEQMDGGGLGELQSGIASLTDEYAGFHAGLIDYTDGVNQLAYSYDELHNGVGDLADGVHEFMIGVNELEDGTGELASETSDLPEQMQSEIDEMMDEFDHSDFEPVSFTSEDNEKIRTVQFVIQTEKITHDEDDEDDEVEDDDESIWDRFLSLFR